MKTTIKIKCEDKRELLMHIDVIKEEIEKLNLDEPFEDSLEFEDHNCYGDHEVKIKDESWSDYAMKRFNEESNQKNNG